MAFELFQKKRPPKDSEESYWGKEKEQITQSLLRGVHKLIDRQARITNQLGDKLDTARQLRRDSIHDPVKGALFDNYGDNNRSIFTMLEAINYQIDLRDPHISAQRYPGEVSRVNPMWQGVDGLEGLTRDDVVIIRRLPIQNLTTGVFVQRGLVSKIEKQDGGDNREALLTEILKEIEEREKI